MRRHPLPATSLLIFSTTAAAILGSVGIAAPAAAQRLHWTRLGVIHPGRSDRGTIRVHSARFYHQVRLCVQQRNVRIVNARVVFRNGREQSMPVGHIVVRGSCTWPANLRGGAQRLREIRVRFHRGPSWGPSITAEAR
jgi:hypothetical protein